MRIEGDDVRKRFRSATPSWIASLIFVPALVVSVMIAPLPAATEEKPSLIIGAASSLRDALEEIRRAFQRTHGAQLTITYAASGRLRAQIKAGAPIDVFLTARSSMLDDMARENSIRSRREFATNALVVVVPTASDAYPKALTSLTESRYARIGIGHPDYVPAGSYARTALAAAGVYETLKPRFVFGEHVRQVLLYVARGEVDAALVYRTDTAGNDRVRMAFEVPPLAEPVAYSAAVTSRAAKPELAEAFVRSLVESEAQAILVKHGFGSLPAAVATPR